MAEPITCQLLLVVTDHQPSWKDQFDGWDSCAVAVGPALSDAFLAPISDDPIGLTGLFITHRLVVFSRFGLVWDLGKRFTIDGSSKQLFTTHHGFQGSHFARIQVGSKTHTPLGLNRKSAPANTRVAKANLKG